MNKKIFILFAVIICALIIPEPSFAQRYEEGEIPIGFRRTTTLPGNIDVDFTMVTLNKYKKEVDEVFDYTFSQTNKIAQLFVQGNAGSEIATIVENAGVKPVPVSKEVLVILEHAKEIAEWTSGAYDMVTGPGNYKQLKLDKKNSTAYLKKAGLGLDLSFMLDGFYADIFTRAASASNIDNSMVSVNGVYRAMGEDAFNPWRIMIEGPGKDKAKKGMGITLTNYSSATVGGRFKAPTVNPRNGKPVGGEFYSVTVITKEAATAQGVATAIYIAGKTEGENLINALGIKAIFAFNDDTFKKVGRW